MRSITELIPDVDVLLNMAPEELGYQILRLAKENEQNGHFHPASFEPNVHGPNYPTHRRQLIDIAIGEALNWLTINMLIMAAPGITGRNGHMVLTRRGRQIADERAFADYRAATAFPKALLHPTIADEVWLDLARGDLSTAVFRSYRSVEEAVRQAGGFRPNDVGVDLMRRAFAPNNGPLTDTIQPVAEQEALSALFAGAIGSYKNPHSHRTVIISDATEAQEMVLLASHLLRIVDSRRP